MVTESQTVADILMIRPARFAGNPQTAESNRFQRAAASRSPTDVTAAACAEFDASVAALRAAGVRVHEFADTPEPAKPDAVFPNNWVSLHADGTVVLYPMLAPNRRLERRMDIIEALTTQRGFHSTRLIDLTHREARGEYLEGTGSLVLDRAHRIAYACLSPRTDPDVLGEFAQRLDYDIVAFDAVDASGVPVYHTNVLMSVGTRFAVVCREAIAARERQAVMETLRSTGHEPIELSMKQMSAFAGNILELRTSAGQSIVAMSATAHAAFEPAQRARLEALAGPILAIPIQTIEHFGGGSLRCMLAEVALPARQTRQK